MYFQANQSPNGAIKKLIRYTIICLETDVEGGIVLSGFPQLEQKLADRSTEALQVEQTILGRVSILLGCGDRCYDRIHC